MMTTTTMMMHVTWMHVRVMMSVCLYACVMMMREMAPSSIRVQRNVHVVPKSAGDWKSIDIENYVVVMDKLFELLRKNR